MSEDLPTLGIPITMAQYSRFCQGTRAGSQGSTQTTHGLLWPMLGNPQAEVCDQREEDQGGGPAWLSRATPPFLPREKEHAGQLPLTPRHLQQPRGRGPAQGLLGHC